MELLCKVQYLSFIIIRTCCDMLAILKQTTHTNFRQKAASEVYTAVNCNTSLFRFYIIRESQSMQSCHQTFAWRQAHEQGNPTSSSKV